MSSCSFSRKRFHGREPVVVDVGCSCRPKLKFFITSLFSSSSSDSSSKHSKSNSTATSKSSSTTYSWTTTSMHYEEIAPSSPVPLPPQSDEAITRTTTMRRRRRRRKKKEKATTADGEGRVARESVAVVKETTEPYVAFKESMEQMIVEKEMYGWDDLNDLLGRFLALNSPCHHRLIFRAFADLWEDTTVAVEVEDHNNAPVTGADALSSPYNCYYY